MKQIRGSFRSNLKFNKTSIFSQKIKSGVIASDNDSKSDSTVFDLIDMLDVSSWVDCSDASIMQNSINCAVIAHSNVFRETQIFFISYNGGIDKILFVDVLFKSRIEGWNIDVSCSESSVVDGPLLALVDTPENET